MKTTVFGMGLGLALFASVAACGGSADEDLGQGVDDVEGSAVTGGGDCISFRSTRSTTLEGSIYVDESYRHPNGESTRPYILKLTSPRCGVDGAPRTVTEVHLAPEQGVELRSLVGKKVRVEGSAFEWHTAWHAREVVFSTKKAEALEGGSKDCIDLGTRAHATLEGKLVVDESFRHPSGETIRPYILALKDSRCVLNGSDASLTTVTEVHLAPEQGVDLGPLVGKSVRIAGFPFEWHTAWHARPIVVSTSEAVEAR